MVVVVVVVVGGHLTRHENVDPGNVEAGAG